jgi:hypothetical protein
LHLFPPSFDQLVNYPGQFNLKAFIICSVWFT